MVQTGVGQGGIPEIRDLVGGDPVIAVPVIQDADRYRRP
jgi:hypothetical protein